MPLECRPPFPEGRLLPLTLCVCGISGQHRHILNNNAKYSSTLNYINKNEQVDISTFLISILDFDYNHCHTHICSSKGYPMISFEAIYMFTVIIVIIIFMVASKSHHNHQHCDYNISSLHCPSFTLTKFHIIKPPSLSSSLCMPCLLKMVAFVHLVSSRC